jgi:type III pantothenate kinase
VSNILAVDAGNTRLKWARHDGSTWCERGHLPIAEAGQVERLQNAWQGLPIDRAIASVVAAPAVAGALERSLNGLGVKLHLVLSARAQCGVRNRYAEPTQLGSDRWAALIAAHHHAARGAEASPQLVVMAGTALTVDALTADGEFLGGLIVAGPELMRAALNRGTARLPAAGGDYESFPTTTLNAIETGAVEASIGAIMRMHARLAARVGKPPLCVLSGGAGALLMPHLQALSIRLRFAENLVLDGLRAIANEMNSGKYP